MRVFVVGTGRCGTVTFSKACAHITNFSSGHETYSRSFFEFKNLSIPDNRIEVDPHFAHVLPLALEKYPDAKWVHLIRARKPCVESIARTTGIKHYAKFASMNESVKIEHVADTFYSVVNANIEMWLKKTNSMTMHLEKLSEEWPAFWDFITAKGSIKDSIKEFETRYNNSKIKYGK